ncbi:hypothetical protein ACFSL6_19920, partial [Paenibacillus thailandensis]|uniref:hypothetical protein n=1 Tax=Paenibacillus thailandensis TaxID=393250 RepID=UPI003630E3DE
AMRARMLDKGSGGWRFAPINLFRRQRSGGSGRPALSSVLVASENRCGRDRFSIIIALYMDRGRPSRKKCRTALSTLSIKPRIML